MDLRQRRALEDREERVAEAGAGGEGFGERQRFGTGAVGFLGGGAGEGGIAEGDDFVPEANAPVVGNALKQLLRRKTAMRGCGL